MHFWIVYLVIYLREIDFLDYIVCTIFMMVAIKCYSQAPKALLSTLLHKLSIHFKKLRKRVWAKIN